MSFVLVDHRVRRYEYCYLTVDDIDSASEMMLIRRLTLVVLPGARLGREKNNGITDLPVHLAVRFPLAIRTAAIGFPAQLPT